MRTAILTWILIIAVGIIGIYLYFTNREAFEILNFLVYTSCLIAVAVIAIRELRKIGEEDAS
jgi:multisubunit Na+/H+ antiporter MnhB subunit